MRKIVIILYLNISILGSFAQSKNDLKSTLILGSYCGPVLTENLTVVRNDSIINMYSENNVLKIKKHIRKENVDFFNRKSKNSKIDSLTYDSLGIILFHKGFLTTDMLIKAHNAERIEINSNGDTNNITSHIDTADYILYHISAKQYRSRKLKRFIDFEISVLHGGDRNPSDSTVVMIIGGIISNFSLTLSGPFEASPENLIDYIEQAKFESLTYITTGIIL
jgi:hypothetical protein